MTGPALLLISRLLSKLHGGYTEAGTGVRHPLSALLCWNEALIRPVGLCDALGPQAQGLWLAEPSGPVPCQ